MKYTVGFYIPSEHFRDIKEHTAIMDTETCTLKAITGPAYDPPSIALAHLFAAAPEMLAILRETADLLEIHRFTFEDEADDMGCDAGNPDGGSTSNCKHCQLKRAIEEIDQILGRVSMVIAAATNKETEASYPCA